LQQYQGGDVNFQFQKHLNQATTHTHHANPFSHGETTLVSDPSFGGDNAISSSHILAQSIDKPNDVPLGEAVITSTRQSSQLGGSNPNTQRIHEQSNENL